MKVLIAGACGFVGSTLARRLKSSPQQHDVVGIDSLVRPGSEQQRAALRQIGVAIRHADVRMASDFETLPAVDVVIDAAANPSVLAGVDGRVSSRQLVEHNLLGTLNMLEYCRRHQATFILLSTSRVYAIKPLAAMPLEVHHGAFRPAPEATMPGGLSGAGISETFSSEPPLSIYGTTKLASEKLALEYGEAFDFPVWIDRCGVLAGAGQFGRADQGIFSYWIHSWLARRPLRMIGFDGQGHQVRDCLHPDDLVPLLEQQMACRSSDRPRVVNVSGGLPSARSLKQLSDWCSERIFPRDVESDPRPRPFDLPWVVLDSALASTTWGWKPQRPAEAIFGEILEHARAHPDWLDITGGE